MGHRRLVKRGGKCKLGTEFGNHVPTRPKISAHLGVRLPEKRKTFRLTRMFAIQQRLFLLAGGSCSYMTDNLWLTRGLTFRNKNLCCSPNGHHWLSTRLSLQKRCLWLLRGWSTTQEIEPQDHYQDHQNDHHRQPCWNFSSHLKHLHAWSWNKLGGRLRSRPRSFSCLMSR